jgi:hypothetical protein
VVTLDQAMHFANNRLPEEGPADELANWRRSMPPPEPKREERKLDTMQVDVRAEIEKAVARERFLLVEATGQALAEYGDQLASEFEALLAQAADKLRAEFAGQLAQMRSQADTLGGELEAALEKIIERKKRAKAAAAKRNHGADLNTAPPLQLPAPNGHAQ